MEVSAYRDYVIEAFNDNLPYDQFVIENIAGDLLPEASNRQKVASGYNRLLQTTQEGGAQPDEYVTIYQADRVRNFGNVWLAATTGCAQCHDHKYDPFTIKDFYSLAAFFADIKEKPLEEEHPTSPSHAGGGSTTQGTRRQIGSSGKSPKGTQDGYGSPKKGTSRPASRSGRQGGLRRTQSRFLH